MPEASKRAYTLPAERLAASKAAKRKFLGSYCESFIVKRAAAAAGVSIHAVYHWRETDEDFKRAFDALRAMRGDALEDAALDRALNGVSEPIVRDSQILGYRTNFPESTTALLLKGLKPAEYRENQQSGGANVNINFGVAVLPPTAPSVEDWEAQALQLTIMQQKISEGLVIEGKAERVEEQPMRIVRI